MSNNPLLWQQSIEKHQARLKKKKCDKLLHNLDYSSFQSMLADENDRYDSSKIARCLRKLRPAIHILEDFTTAISNLAQTKPAPLALIWGSLQVLLIVSNTLSVANASILLTGPSYCWVAKLERLACFRDPKLQAHDIDSVPTSSKPPLSRSQKCFGI